MMVKSHLVFPTALSWIQYMNIMLYVVIGIYSDIQADILSSRQANWSNNDWV